MRTFVRAFLTELRCRIFSLNFAVPVIIVTAGYIASMYQERRAPEDIIYFWDLVQNIGYFTSLSILSCTALNCTAFLNDYRSDYYRSSVIRSGKRNYTLSKFLACIIAGGLTLFLGAMFFILILSFRYPFVLPETVDQYSHAVEFDFRGILLRDGHYFGLYALLGFMAFLFGALWSAVGICVSAFITDRYVASFSPYVIWYTFRGLLPGKFRTEIVFHGHYNFGGVGGSILFAVVYFGLIIAAMGVIFCIKAGRRCEN